MAEIPAKIKMNDGDWICPDPGCGNINFSHRLSCNRCQKDRGVESLPSGGGKKKVGIEIGKSAAEKSRGLFSADDWQCNKCANVNWARRVTCNVCNAPRYGEVEARTGYGGGYNERGVVEYRRREESSDDEFDEFGRRRKRKRVSAADTSANVDAAGGGKETSAPNAAMLPTATRLKLVTGSQHPETRPPHIKISGSVSDDSTFEYPALTQNNLKTFKQLLNKSHEKIPAAVKLPPAKINLDSYRERNRKRRYNSGSGEVERTGSSGYETGSKIEKHRFPSSVVVEERTTSANNVTLVFKGDTPVGNFKVTYSIEERVRAAALAIVYNNCRISSDKFQNMFDKPAPDFNTIFAWRQRLLSTGCLIDAHLDIQKSSRLNKDEVDRNEKKVMDCAAQNLKTDSIADRIKCGGSLRKGRFYNLPPDQTNPVKYPEVPAVLPHSGSENEPASSIRSLSKPRESSLQRSVLIKEAMNPIAPSSRDGFEESSQRSLIPGICDDQNSSSPIGKAISSNQTCRSHSLDSVESNYHETNLDSNKMLPLKQTSVGRNSVSLISNSRSNLEEDDSESDIQTDDFDFRSKLYEKRTKNRKKKMKKNAKNSIGQQINYQQDGLESDHESQKSPPRTFYSYQPNPKPVENLNVSENESCLSEYVPTALGSSNYREFKDNVIKQMNHGFWAKGVSTTHTNPEERNMKKITVSNSTKSPSKQEVTKKEIYSKGYITNQVESRNEFGSAKTFDFERVSPELSDRVKATILGRQFVQFPHHKTAKRSQQELEFTVDDFFSSSHAKDFENRFDTADENEPQSDDTVQIEERPIDHNVNVFEASMCESSGKKSILDIFGDNDDTFEVHQKEEIKTFSMRRFETEWDEDDDALYGNSDKDNHSDDDVPRAPTPPSIGSLRQDDIANEDLETVENIAAKVAELTSNNNQFDDEETLHTEKSNTNSGRNNQHLNKSNESIINDLTSTVGSPQHQNLEEILQDTNSAQETSQENIINDLEQDNEVAKPKDIPQLDMGKLSQFLGGINFDINASAIALALQNIQQLSKESVKDNNSFDNSNGDRIFSESKDKAKTIDDIFDPGPVSMPQTMYSKQPAQNRTPEKELEHTSPSKGPITLGSFKSFALPKPIMLSRLKSLNQNKNPDFCDSSSESTAVLSKPKKMRKKKPLPESKGGSDAEREVAQAAGVGGGEEDEEEEEESGDEADLAKYELWESDQDESKADKPKTTDDKQPETSASKSDPQANGRPSTPEGNSPKNRSRSSSSSSGSSSSSSSSRSSAKPTPRNKYDDFNLNSEKEWRSDSRSRSPPSPRRQRSPPPRAAGPAPPRRKSRSSADSRSHDRDRPHHRERGGGGAGGRRPSSGGGGDRRRPRPTNNHYYGGRPR